MRLAITLEKVDIIISKCSKSQNSRLKKIVCKTPLTSQVYTASTYSLFIRLSKCQQNSTGILTHLNYCRPRRHGEVETRFWAPPHKNPSVFWTQNAAAASICHNPREVWSPWNCSIRNLKHLQFKVLITWFNFYPCWKRASLEWKTKTHNLWQCCPKSQVRPKLL